MGFEISQDQIDHFEEEGYLILPAVFEKKEVEDMRREADFILELIVNSSICNDRRSGRLDIRAASHGQIARKIQPVNDLSLYLSQVSKDERLVGPLAQLMSDEPILLEEKLNYKEPLKEPVNIESKEMEDQFPVHNDWAYYRAQNYPQETISSAAE